jgi:hypothetical protein
MLTFLEANIPKEVNIMNTVDAKIIKTQYGSELYVDDVEHINFKSLHAPEANQPLYRIEFEIGYFLLKEHRYYEYEQNYFWLAVSEDFSKLIIQEPDMESLFGAKSEEERKATKELLSQWLIHTEAYKNLLKQHINDCKKSDETNQDITAVLEKLLSVSAADIEQAPIEKLTASRAV